MSLYQIKFFDNELTFIKSFLKENKYLEGFVNNGVRQIG